MAHDYCCCAIPLVRFGIYIVLLEQFVLAILVGTLSIATPKIVGASLPTFAPWVLAIVCYVVAALQPVGLAAVSKSNLKLFRTYAGLNTFGVSAAFGVAAAFIGLSAGRHSTNSKTCQNSFFQDDSGLGSATGLASKSSTICDVFTWLDVGLMAGLWVLLAIFQFYLLFVTKFYRTKKIEEKNETFTEYGVDFNADDDAYVSGGGDRDAREVLGEAIPLSSRAAPDPYQGQDRLGHGRRQSSVGSVMTLGAVGTTGKFEAPNKSSYEHYPPPSGQGYQQQQQPYRDNQQGFYDPYEPR